MNEPLQNWLESGKYLPEVIRDFHDAKDVFKTMHAIVNMDNNTEAGKVNWIMGQCYVIDIFLWFMARRGYTLQRSRAKLDFADLAADVQSVKDAESKAFAAMFSQTTIEPTSANLVPNMMFKDPEGTIPVTVLCEAVEPASAQGEKP